MNLEAKLMEAYFEAFPQAVWTDAETAISTMVSKLAESQQVIIGLMAPGCTCDACVEAREFLENAGCEPASPEVRNG